MRKQRTLCKEIQINKRLLFILIIIFESVLLTACQMENPIKIDALRDNITIIDYFENSGFGIIDEVVMEKRQTDKDEKRDDIFCQIVVNDTKIKKIGKYEIISNYYDEGGWIIDEIIELSCYYEPIEEPDILNIVYGYDCQYIDYRGIDRRTEYPPEIGSAIYNDDYEVDHIAVAEVEWPLDNHGDEIWGKISYSEVYEYNNFKKEDYYNLYVCFDTFNGVWQAETNEFTYSEYTNFRFEGKYMYCPSGMYIAGDDGTYIITFSNCDENGLGTDLRIEGTIDGGIWDEDCIIQQQGNTHIEGYDMQDLPEELRKMADTYFEEPVRSRPGILFRVQCKGMSCGSPDAVEDVYVLVSKWNCYLLVRETGYMRSYRVLNLNYEDDIYSKVTASTVADSNVEETSNIYVRTNNQCKETERVFDYADKLTDEEEAQLRALIAEREDEIGCDIVLVIINDPSVSSDYDMMNYADDFYDNNMYGYNKPWGDGALYLDNWANGYCWFSTCGRVKSRYSAIDIERLIDQVCTKVNRNPYDAYETYVNSLSHTMMRQSAYILPESDRRYLDTTDLYGLSAEECRLARNELYARHGRKFDDEILRTYFESKDWYSGTIDPADFKEEMLSDYEIYNRDLIAEYEKEQGYR